jgi:hypothetical protein
MHFLNQLFFQHEAAMLNFLLKNVAYIQFIYKYHCVRRYAIQGFVIFRPAGSSVERNRTGERHPCSALNKKTPESLPAFG